MSGKRVIRDEIQYILFTEVYHKLETPKAKRKAFALVEAAIQTLGRKGFDGFTLDGVAREAGVTRQFLKHYFDDAEDLRLTTIKYIRLLFQKLAVDAMMKKNKPDESLGAYVDSCFHWVENFRTHAVVWFSFVNRCTRNKSERALNTLAVHAGQARLSALLESGKSAGLFTHARSEDTAKLIQVLVTGAMIVSASEDFADLGAFTRLVRWQCLELTRVQ